VGLGSEGVSAFASMTNAAYIEKRYAVLTIIDKENIDKQ
jgi:hypothetical protein